MSAYTFGHYLRDLRARRDVSLSRAAMEIGCSKAHLWEMEDGRADNPTIKLLQGVADFYGRGVMEVAHYAAGHGDAFPRAPTTPTPASPAERTGQKKP